MTPNEWNAAGRLEDFIGEYEGWRFDWLDLPDLIRRTQFVLEYPMVDRDPVERWTFGRTTLLGDAAQGPGDLAAQRRRLCGARGRTSRWIWSRSSMLASRRCRRSTSRGASFGPGSADDVLGGVRVQRGLRSASGAV